MKYFIAIFLIMLTSGCHHINKRQNGQAESNGQIVKLSTIVTEVQKVVDIYAYWAKSEVGSTPLKSAEITLQNGFESKSGKGISFFLSYSHESVVTKNNHTYRIFTGSNKIHAPISLLANSFFTLFNRYDLN